MISRAKVARFIEGQMVDKHPDLTDLNARKHSKFHYGLQELRDLMDKIYGGKPTNAEDMISSEGTYGDHDSDGNECSIYQAVKVK